MEITNSKAPLNFIWFIVDSVRHYRGASDDRDKLEVMDKLASEAAEFETVVTSAASSLMSVSAMFTGCPSYLISRDFDNFSYDGSTFISIGEILKRRGYQTYGIFQYAYGRERLGGKAMDLVASEHFPPGLEMNRRWTNDEINQILFSLLASGLREPFFLCLWYNCREDMETSSKVESAIDRIKESGLYDRSVIIMNSDHGYPDPSRGVDPQWFKRQNLTHDLILTDDNIRVPLYIRHPELAPRKIKTPAATIDIMPTALELLGISHEPEETPMMSGRSLAPLLRNEDAPELKDRMFRTDARYLRQTNRRTSIRSSQYKYVFNHDDQVEEFYDLNEDSLEYHDLISSSHLAQTIEHHRREFKRTEDTAVRFHLQYLLSQNKYLADGAEGINKALVLYSQTMPNVELALQVIRNQFDGTSLDILTPLPVSKEVSGLFNEIIQANGSLDRQSLPSIHPALQRRGYDIVVVLASENKSQQHRKALSLARWLGRRPPLVLDSNLNAMRHRKRSWRGWLKRAFERRKRYRYDPVLLVRDLRKYGARLLT